MWIDFVSPSLPSFEFKVSWPIQAFWRGWVDWVNSSSSLVEPSFSRWHIRYNFCEGLFILPLWYFDGNYCLHAKRFVMKTDHVFNLAGTITNTRAFWQKILVWTVSISIDRKTSQFVIWKSITLDDINIFKCAKSKVFWKKEDILVPNSNQWLKNCLWLVCFTSRIHSTWFSLYPN